MLKQAGFICWTIFTIISMICIAALFILPHDTVYSISEILSTPHEKPCLLCGMTTGALAIADCNISKALSANGLSLPLFGFTTINGFIFLIIGVTHLRKQK